MIVWCSGALRDGDARRGKAVWWRAKASPAAMSEEVCNVKPTVPPRSLSVSKCQRQGKMCEVEC